MTTGRTVEEALETALDQLGVDEQDAELEVLQEPQRGLFGRVRVEAQIRARVRPSPPPPKVDRRERRRRDRGRRDGERPRSRTKSGSGGRSTGGSGSDSGSGSRGGGSGGAGRRGGRSSTDSRAEARVATDGNGAEGGPGDRSGHQDRAGRSGGGDSGSLQGGGQPRKRRRRRSSGAGKAEGAGVVSESTTATDVDETFDIEAQREAVEDFLRGLLESFGRPDATVVVTVAEEDTLEATVEGSELGLLVGQKGTTLQSLQELVRSMVQRRFVGQAHARVRVDVAGYRERRRAALERFTADVAATVRESGVAKALDPMGPADRKVVHDAVNDIEGVETVSQGEDDDRHVVIRPTT